MFEIKSMIHEVAQRARIQTVCGQRAPVVNCTAFEDEVCAEMLRLFPNAPFSACWHERVDGSHLWKLRHRNPEDGITEWIEPAFDVESLITERDELQSELVRRLHDIP